jgi:hypothetical protein
MSNSGLWSAVVVPQGLQQTVVAPDAGPTASSYDMNAAFMLFQRHERGIHAVSARCWSDALEATARFHSST